MQRRTRGRPLSLLLVGFLLWIPACEHDPTVLETHPLDLRGALTREVQSIYLTMSDGVRIAVDVHVPRDYPGGGPFPTILEMTRYWRSRGDEAPVTLRRASRRGFAYVVMDERGTGGSFGAWTVPLSKRALQDAWEVMDWIVAQPWSNGKIGANGVSYPGMAAHQMAADPHPALKAIVPMSHAYDLYEDLLFPGGMLNEGFLQEWSDILYAMDRNTSLVVGGESFLLKPVDEDTSGQLLAEALAGHAMNLNVFDAFEDIVFRDDVSGAGFTLDQLSTSSAAASLAESGVAIYQWGSWLDAGSADGVLRAFMESPGPQRAVIGSWTHDLSGNALTGDGDRWTAHPSREAQWEEALNFFDDVLRKGKSLGDRTLRYYTMGEGLWKETNTWPVPGAEKATYYLDEGGSLSLTAPAAATAEDEYAVDFQARSSDDPRWLGPLFTDTWYPDREDQDSHLLIYESAPLPEDMEVTGYPVVKLNVAATREDAAFFVYLEDVSPQGTVTYVTEGVLRALHRRIGQDSRKWKSPIPYHSFLSTDAEPLVPGEIAELAFGLEPTSFLFRQGHRIRMAIGGHDASAFRPVPADETSTVRIQRNQAYPSILELPVVPRDSQGG